MTSPAIADMGDRRPASAGRAAAGAHDVAHARPRRRPDLVVLYGIALLLLAQTAAFLIGNERLGWSTVAEYLFDPLVLRGVVTTVVLTVICMVVGLVVGMVVAIARMSPVTPFRFMAAGWLTIFRSIPPLVQLLFWYNLAYLMPTISLGVPFGPSFGGWDANTVITPFFAAVVGISLYQSPYSAEIIRAGLLSVPEGQMDAAKSLGYTPSQVFRRIRLPQSMRVIIPPMGNDLIRTAKGTSLVAVIAMTDILGAVQTIYSRNFQVIPLLLVAVLWYMALISVLWVVQSWLERRFGRGVRRGGA